MPKLTATDISVRFGGITALAEVSLSLAPGEILGLIGANGAGKSTLINVLSGFQRPSTGRVTLGGQAVDRLPPHRLARAGIARTFQSVRLFPELTVHDNVAAVAALGRGGPDDGPAGLLDLLGLAAQAGRLAGALAYADQRRLAVARALALAPQFLLLDEPAAGMSPAETADLRGILARIRDRSGLGLLLVEHNMDLVMAVCDRIVVLDVGRMIAGGTPDAVRRDPAVRRAYLGGLDEGAQDVA